MSGREICCANLTMWLRPKRKSWKHLQKKGKKLYNNKINWSLTNFVKKAQPADRMYIYYYVKLSDLHGKSLPDP